MAGEAVTLPVHCANCGKVAAVVRVPAGDVKALLRDAVPLEYRALLSLLPSGIDSLSVIRALAADRVECIRCTTSTGGNGGNEAEGKGEGQDSGNAQAAPAAQVA